MNSYLWYAGILAVLFVIIWIISSRTCLLKNVVFDDSSFHSIANNQGLAQPKAAYSWSRVQFAFWTIVIVGSAIYVWIIKCGCSTNTISMALDPVNLALLGVSIATTAIAKAIDGSQQDQPSASTDSAQQNQPSKGFFTDIISDETGVSIHRLQNVLWTAVVGYIYISHVFEKCAMPDNTVISATMIGLMGLSSAGYLGVKATENSAPPSKPSIAYNPPVNSFTAGAPITPLTPVNTGGAINFYTINPQPVNGLAFNGTTGVISGRPATAMDPIAYTITANGTGFTSTATVTIGVH